VVFATGFLIPDLETPSPRSREEDRCSATGKRGNSEKNNRKTGRGGILRSRNEPAGFPHGTSAAFLVLKGGGGF